jgi:tRNA uridine 5-carboxymethylaminomethyl modification enzyme
MFTSRAEHRLLLRHDNADQRLTRKAWEIGLVGERRNTLLTEKMERLDRARNVSNSLQLNGSTLFHALKLTEFIHDTLKSDLLLDLGLDILELLETEAKYEGYIRRHQDQLRSLESAQAISIPTEINYAAVPGLRNEARQKLLDVRPSSIGQAGRISGVTPSDIGILTIWLRRKYSKQTVIRP